MPAALRILDLLCFAAFALFSAVQYNDVDPEIYDHPSSIDAGLWLLFYALVAVLFLVGVFRAVPRGLLAIAVLACLIQLGRSGPGLWENLVGDQSFTITQESMSAEDPRVELSREFFGALLALAGCVWLWRQRDRWKTT